MKLLRVLRGALGTAIAWALPWAVVGAALQLVTALTIPGAATQLESPLTLASFTLQGGLLFGGFGALTGGAFALILSALAHRLTFAQLRDWQVASAGALGGVFTVGAFLIGLELFSSAQVVVTASAYGVVTFLAAGSAWTMLRIARRAELGPGSSSEEPVIRAGVAGRLAAHVEDAE